MIWILPQQVRHSVGDWEWHTTLYLCSTRLFNEEPWCVPELYTHRVKEYSTRVKCDSHKHRAARSKHAKPSHLENSARAICGGLPWGKQAWLNVDDVIAVIRKHEPCWMAVVVVMCVYSFSRAASQRHIPLQSPLGYSEARDTERRVHDPLSTEKHETRTFQVSYLYVHKYLSLYAST